MNARKRSEADPSPLLTAPGFPIFVAVIDKKNKMFIKNILLLKCPHYEVEI